MDSPINEAREQSQRLPDETVGKPQKNDQDARFIEIRVPGFLPLVALAGAGIVLAYGLLQNSKNSTQSLANIAALNQSQNAQNNPQKLEDIDSRLQSMADSLGTLISKQGEREPQVDKIKAGKSSWLESDSGFTSTDPMPAVHTRYQDGKVLTRIYQVERSKSGKSKYIYNFTGEILSFCQDGYIMDVPRKFRIGESPNVSRTPTFDDCADNKLTKEDALNHRVTHTPLQQAPRANQPTNSTGIIGLP